MNVRNCEYSSIFFIDLTSLESTAFEALVKGPSKKDLRSRLAALIFATDWLLIDQSLGETIFLSV